MNDTSHESSNGIPQSLADALEDVIGQIQEVCFAHRALLKNRDEGDSANAALAEFQRAFERADDLLDAMPPGVLQDLSQLLGKPWDLATRRALNAIAITPVIPSDYDEEDKLLRFQQLADFSNLPTLTEQLRERILDLVSLSDDAQPVTPPWYFEEGPPVDGTFYRDFSIDGQLQLLVQCAKTTEPTARKHNGTRWWIKKEVRDRWRMWFPTQNEYAAARHMLLQLDPIGICYCAQFVKGREEAWSWRRSLRARVGG